MRDVQNVITIRRQIDIVTYYKPLYFLLDTSLCLFADELQDVLGMQSGINGLDINTFNKMLHVKCHKNIDRYMDLIHVFIVHKSMADIKSKDIHGFDTYF